MGLNKTKGNMYGFITHTWNAIKGACSHDCNYCYMKRWGKLNPVRLDEKELKTDLGEGNFIFVGSSTDMFAKDVPDEWIEATLKHLNKFPNNKYLLQTKNPERYLWFADLIGNNMTIGTTIETNRVYSDYMGNTPTPERRASAMKMYDHPKFVTVEPVLDFDDAELVDLLLSFNPKWINIGADSGGHQMIEPPRDKVAWLISFLRESSNITIKKNMKRLTDEL